MLFFFKARVDPKDMTVSFMVLRLPRSQACAVPTFVGSRVRTHSRGIPQRTVQPERSVVTAALA